MRKVKPALLIASIIFIACRKQPAIPPAVVNEPENITKIQLTFVDSITNSSTAIFTWNDADGNGGNNPTIDSIKLKSNTTYYCNLTVLDESKNPAVDVSEEILEEGVDHQFFFQSTNQSIKLYYNDTDKNGNPIGLKTKWRTSAESISKMNIFLKHQPGVKAPSPGDKNAGSSDIDITFETIIKN
jgi:hypothetical protein